MKIAIRVRQNEAIVVQGDHMGGVSYLFTEGMNPCIGLVLWHKKICAMAHIDDWVSIGQCKGLISHFVKQSKEGPRKAVIVKAPPDAVIAERSDAFPAELERERRAVAAKRSSILEVPDSEMRADALKYLDEEEARPFPEYDRRWNANVWHSESMRTDLEKLIPIPVTLVKVDSSKNEGTVCADVRVELSSGDIDYNFTYPNAAPLKREPSNTEWVTRPGSPTNGKSIIFGFYTGKKVVEYRRGCDGYADMLS